MSGLSGFWTVYLEKPRFWAFYDHLYSFMSKLEPGFIIMSTVLAISFHLSLYGQVWTNKSDQFANMNKWLLCELCEFSKNIKIREKIDKKSVSFFSYFI